jgi:hypothetical protein
MCFQILLLAQKIGEMSHVRTLAKLRDMLIIGKESSLLQIACWPKSRNSPYDDSQAIPGKEVALVNLGAMFWFETWAKNWLATQNSKVSEDVLLVEISQVIRDLLEDEHQPSLQVVPSSTHTTFTLPILATAALFAICCMVLEFSLKTVVQRSWHVVADATPEVQQMDLIKTRGRGTWNGVNSGPWRRSIA